MPTRMDPTQRFESAEVMVSVDVLPAARAKTWCSPQMISAGDWVPVADSGIEENGVFGRCG